jgi:hypothetical protein
MMVECAGCGKSVSVGTPHICIWQEKDTGKWIVSRDTLDETGGATTTHTLDVCDTRKEAEESAASER